LEFCQCQRNLGAGGRILFAITTPWVAKTPSDFL
jgi:hypothetical protein